jgi:hypothetical protein
VIYILTTIDDGWEHWLATGEGNPPGWDDTSWSLGSPSDADTAWHSGFVVLSAMGGGKSAAFAAMVRALAEVDYQAASLARKLVQELSPARSHWASTVARTLQTRELDDLADLVVLGPEPGKVQIFQAKRRSASPIRDRLASLIRNYLQRSPEDSPHRGSCRLHTSIDQVMDGDVLKLLDGYRYATLLVGRVESGKSSLLAAMRAAHRRTLARILDVLFSLVARDSSYQELSQFLLTLRAVAAITLLTATDDPTEYPGFSVRAARFAQFSSTR